MKNRAKIKILVILIQVLGIALISSILVVSIIIKRYQTRDFLLNQARLHYHNEYERILLNLNFSHESTVTNYAKTGMLSQKKDEADYPSVSPIMKSVLPVRRVHLKPCGLTKTHGLLVKLTSLRPLDEENSPDRWEIEAMRELLTGRAEIYDVIQKEGIHYLRYIKPLIAEEQCIRCHYSHEKSNNAVLGGISLIMPIEKIYMNLKIEYVLIAVANLFILLTGFIAVSSIKSAEQIRKGASERFIELKKSHELKEKTAAVLFEHNRELCRELNDAKMENSRFKLINQGFAQEADTTNKREKLIRSIFDTVGNVIFFLSPEFRIIDINRAAESVTGLPREKVVGFTIFNIFTSELYGEKMPEIYRRVLDDIYIEDFEDALINAQGEKMHMLWNMTSLMDGVNIAGIIMSGNNITGRKYAEQTLSMDQMRFETLYRLTQLEGRSEKEILDFALEESVRITESKIGYIYLMNEDETELILHSWSKGVMNDCTMLIKPTVYKVSETGLWGEAVRQRKPVITNDYDAPSSLKKGYPEGHVPIKRHMNAPLIKNGKIVLIAGVGNKEKEYDERDVRYLLLIMDGMWKIIKKRETEKCLYVKNRALSFSINAMVFMNCDGIITDVNSSFAKMWGYCPELSHAISRYPDCARLCPDREFVHHELIGKNINEFTVGSFTDIFSELEPRGGWTGEVTAKKRDGTLFTIHVSATMLHDDDGKPYTIMASCVDVSYHKQIEAELKRSIMDREVLLKEIHHRVKNNLGIMYSLVHFEKETYGRDDSTSLVLANMQNRIMTMAMIHQKLYRSNDLRSIDFQEYCGDLVNQLVNTYDDGSSDIRVMQDVQKVFLDIDTVLPCGLIITEMVTNSMKYAFTDERKGEISVSFEMDERGLATLAVSDNGIGLPENFDPNKSDTMGMFIVRSLVDQLKGSIQIDRKRKGTRLIIAFPVKNIPGG